MTLWTPQQLNCLKALGVTVYKHTRGGISSNNTEASADSEQPYAELLPESQAVDEPTVVKISTSSAAQEALGTTYYKLGPWVFEFSDTIPVESYDWLSDLAAYCQSVPSQISASDKTLCLKKFNRNQLSPADKKELWSLLKTNL